MKLLARRSATFWSACALGLALLSAVVQAPSILSLRQRNDDLRRRLPNLRQAIDSAERTLKQVRELEQQTAQARADIQQLFGEHHGESALVWFPNHLREHLDHFGIHEAMIRLNTVRNDETLTGYRRAYWGVGMPVENGTKDLTQLLYAAAELEEKDRFVKVLDFAVRPDAEDPQRRTVAINLMALVHE